MIKILLIVIVLIIIMKTLNESNIVKMKNKIKSMNQSGVMKAKNKTKTINLRRSTMFLKRYLFVVRRKIKTR